MVSLVTQDIPVTFLVFDYGTDLNSPEDIPDHDELKFTSVRPTGIY